MMQVIDRLNDKSWKTLGYLILAFLLGFAAGNGHTTDNALKGSARWWQQDEHQKVLLQKSLDRKALAIDAGNK